MKLKLLIVFLAVAFLQTSFAQESASSILDKAYKQAAQENKNVLIIFHASWCGLCKKMDANINDASCKAFFDKSYVIEHLVVLESEKNKHLENPGALDLLRKHKAEHSGIPFWLFYDSKGNLLANAFNKEGQNIGCPGSKEEVAAFVSILKKTSHLTDDELEIISEKFVIKE